MHTRFDNALYAVVRWAQRVVGALTMAAVVGFAAAALFGSPRAHAQTSTACPARPTCDPQTVKDRTQCGAELKGTTATGQWRAWWFPATKTPAQWQWCAFHWAMLDKYAPTDPRSVISVVDALKDAPDLPAAIMDALTRLSVKPPAGSQDEYEYALLHYAACQALRANPAATWLTPPAPCVAPVAPAPNPPPTVTYVVTGTQAFAFDPAGNNGAGVRSITPLATAPVKGATCDCTTPPMPYMQFGARWCYVAPLVVTGCAAKK